MSEKSAQGYEKLKAELAAGLPHGLYIFEGEETYLKEHYKNMTLKKFAENGFEDFNIAELEAESLNFSALSDAVQSLPVMAEEKLILIRDLNFSKVSEELKPLLAEILEAPQEGICIIFYFDTLDYKPDKRIKLWQSALKNCTIAEFSQPSQGELNSWIKRRFSECKKYIQNPECEYLTFTCGGLMTNLASEIAKIAAGAQTENITKADIDNLASKALDAKIFELTNCVSANEYAKAIDILRELLAMKFETVVLMGAISKQIHKLYCAKLAMKNGLDEAYLMKQFGMRSQYPATMLLRAAQKRSLEWLREATVMCAEIDLALKSNIPDDARTIELFLLRLANLKL